MRNTAAREQKFKNKKKTKKRPNIDKTRILFT